MDYKTLIEVLAGIFILVGLWVYLYRRRPMLRAHIPDIVEGRQSITAGSKSHEASIKEWREIECHWTQKEVRHESKDELRHFFEILAVDLYTKREERGERVEPMELEELARRNGINLQSWITGGSRFDSRDADGHYKFLERRNAP